MKALLLKDIRVNRLVLIVGAALLFGPPIVGVSVNLYSQARFGRLVHPWPDMLVYAGETSLVLSLLTAAMLGGNAVAAERADRSAEFLAYLPPSRGQIITSKAIVAIGGGVLIWLVNVIIVYALAPALGEMDEHLHYFRDRAAPILLSTTVFLFGGAWLASTMMSSPANAVGIAFGPPWLVYFILALIRYQFEVESFPIERWYIVIATIFGPGAFLAGLFYYTRRLEP